MTNGTGNVSLLKENEDGSAVYQFEFPQEALEALTRLGIMTAIRAGIEEAKPYHPEYRTEFTDEIKELAEKAGFALWGDESWKPEGAVIDWSCNNDEELIKFYYLVKESMK
jgi:hypothetical protein